MKTIIGILLVIIGFAGGFLIRSIIKSPATNPSLNKLFAYFDTYSPMTEGRGVDSIRLIDTEKKLFIIEYWTSQETSEYGVYDYKNNELYLGIGGSTIAGSSTPLAFVGSDKLLMYSHFEDTPPVLFVQDFYNKSTKTLLTGIKIREAGSDFYNKTIVIYADTQPLTTYILNQEDLNLYLQN